MSTVVLEIDGSRQYLTVAAGDAVKIPALQRAGYELNGWYTDKQLTNQYDLSIPVTKDLVLYASWKLERVNTLYHLPDFYRDIPELQAVCAGYDSLFKQVFGIIDQSKLNIYIETMDEESIYHWEMIIGVDHNGTLDDRRFRLRLRMYNELPYTRYHLEDLITLFVPKEQFALNIDTSVPSVDLLIAYHSEHQAKSLYDFMCRVTPASMVMSVGRLENIYDDISQFTYQELQDKALSYFEVLTDYRLRRANQ